MKTTTISNPTQAHVPAHTDEYFEANSDAEASEIMRAMRCSHAEISIDFEAENIYSYGGVVVNTAVEMVDCKGGFRFRLDSGDVVKDFNRAAYLLVALGISGYCSPNVHSFAASSVRAFSSTRRGVVIDRESETIPLLRVAAPHEYLYPLRDFVQ